jgi:hypothetical protein
LFLGRRTLRALAVALLLGSPLATGAAGAQPAPAAQPVPSTEARQDLRHALEQRYQVLPLHDGVALTPRQELHGVRSIEVSGDSIAVNGELVSPRTLRDWLGEDATAILRLQALPPSERRALFDFGSETVPPAAAARPETGAPGTPTVGATPSDEDVEVPEPPEPPEPIDSPEPPEPHGFGHTSTGSQVKLASSITVDENELAEEAVAIGGSVRVDGEVSRDVVAIGGPVRINGHVGGNVMSVGSSVHLGPHAVIDGDVSTVGGTIDRAAGAVIHGDSSEVGMAPFVWNGGFHRDWDVDEFGPFSWLGRAFASVVGLILAALLVCLTLLLGRGTVERVERHLLLEPWKAAGVGLAACLLALPLLFVVSIVLILTIIGCALFLLYPFVFLALMIASLVGYTAVALRLGRLIEARFGRSFGSPYVAVLVGVLLIKIWKVLGHLLGMGPGVLDFFGGMLVLIGAIVQFAAVVTGFGAVLLAWAESGYYRPWRRTPPIPVVPPAPPSTPPPGYPVDSLPLSDREPGPPPPPPTWEEPPPER